MKPVLLSLAALVLCQLAIAQFSSNPSTPLAVSAAGNSQTTVTAIRDTITSKQGYFVFWLDQRSSSRKEVYGQRLDTAGNPLWETNGRLIATASQTIFAYTAIAWQQGILLSYLINQDTIMAVYLDSSGQNKWANPSLVARKDPAASVIYVTGTGCFNNIPTATGATITYSPLFTGGASAIAYNKINFDGDVLLANNSKTYALSGYDYRSIGDGAGGFYALSKGNGIGSTITIDRIDANGAKMWASGKEITGGSSNGFSGDIDMSVNANHDLYVSWDATNGDILTTKILASGNFAWASSRVEATAAGTSTGYRSFSRLYNDSLYVTWMENSNNNTVTNAMLQKIGPDGGLSLPAGGVSVGLANYYYGYPKLAFSNNAVIAAFSMNNNNTVGLAAYGINTNNSPTWGGQKIFSNAYNHWNFYQDMVMMDDPNGCNVIFWGGFDGNVYAANLCMITGILPIRTGTIKAENFGARNKISWEGYNEINGDHYEVEKSDDAIHFNNIASVKANATKQYSIWDDQPIAGANFYRIKLISASGDISYSNIAKVIVSKNGFTISVYPNPVKNLLQVKLGNTPTDNASISILDMTGKQLQSQSIHSSNISIDMSAFSKGQYFIKYTDGVSTVVQKIQKY